MNRLRLKNNNNAAATAPPVFGMQAELEQRHRAILREFDAKEAALLERIKTTKVEIRQYEISLQQIRNEMKKRKKNSHKIRYNMFSASRNSNDTDATAGAALQHNYAI